VAMGPVFPPVLRLSPVRLIPPVLHYTEKLIIFMTGLHNKPQSCGASVAPAAGPFTTKQSEHLGALERHGKSVSLSTIRVNPEWRGRPSDVDLCAVGWLLRRSLSYTTYLWALWEAATGPTARRRLPAAPGAIPPCCRSYKSH
jgi:hypothetical protein